MIHKYDHLANLNCSLKYIFNTYIYMSYLKLHTNIYIYLLLELLKPKILPISFFVLHSGYH